MGVVAHTCYPNIWAALLKGLGPLGYSKTLSQTKQKINTSNIFAIFILKGV